jgi:ankyrin repeat protein
LGNRVTYAFKFNDIDFIKYLFDKGADANLFYGFENCSSTLSLVLNFNNFGKQFNRDLVKLLLEKGADPNKISIKFNYSTQLIEAVELNDLDLVKWKLKVFFI